MDTYGPNLKATTTCCPRTPDVKQELIEVKCKIPSNTDIVGRFLGLFKGRQNRVTKIYEEFLKLFIKLNIRKTKISKNSTYETQ